MAEFLIRGLPAERLVVGAQATYYRLLGERLLLDVGIGIAGYDRDMFDDAIVESDEDVSMSGLLLSLGLSYLPR